MLHLYSFLASLLLASQSLVRSELLDKEVDDQTCTTTDAEPSCTSTLNLHGLTLLQQARSSTISGQPGIPRGMTRVTLETWGNTDDSRQMNFGGMEDVTDYYRPQFAKFLRCSDDTTESCEECPRCFAIGEYDAASHSNDNQNGLDLEPSQLSGWHRAVVVAFLNCAEETGPGYFQFRADVGGGTVNAYVNGGPLQPLVGSLPVTSSGIVRANLPVGPSEVWLEYVPSSTDVAQQSLRFRYIQFWVPPEFFSCSDAKVCLRVWHSNEALDLRGTNRLQAECLTNGGGTDKSQYYCQEWLNCLDEQERNGAGNHKQKLLNILNAVSKAPEPEAVPTSMPEATTASMPACSDPQPIDLSGQYIQVGTPPSGQSIPSSLHLVQDGCHGSAEDNAFTYTVVGNTITAIIGGEEVTGTIHYVSFMGGYTFVMDNGLMYWPSAAASLLEHGVVNTSSSFSQTGGLQATMKAFLQRIGKDEEHCLDPAIDDPESWECSCYDNAVANCALIEGEDEIDEVLCVRSQLCISTYVCESWKNTFCHNLGVYGGHFSPTLLQRTVSTHSKSNAELLQRALLDKRLQSLQRNEASEQISEFDATQTAKCND